MIYRFYGFESSLNQNIFPRGLYGIMWSLNVFSLYISGKMKGIAFIKDPDGYWIEIFSAENMVPLTS